MIYGNKLYSITQYQQTLDNELFTKIAVEFMPLIEKNLNYAKMKKIDEEELKDLKQTLLIKLNQIVLNFKIVNHPIQEKYFDLFTNECCMKTIEDYETLQKEYQAFCNYNNFKKYLKVSMHNEVISYMKKYTASQNKIKLNDKTKDEMELLEFVPDYEVKQVEYDYSKLTKKDLEFLNLFIENTRILTSTEVSKKLNISRQAVNKRKNRIKAKVQIEGW